MSSKFQVLSLVHSLPYCDLSKSLSTFKNDNIFPGIPRTVYTICIDVSLIFLNCSEFSALCLLDEEIELNQGWQEKK